jgi:hypothetical protein
MSTAPASWTRAIAAAAEYPVASIGSSRNTPTLLHVLGELAVVLDRAVGVVSR